MMFVIQGFDRPDGAADRAKYGEAHVAHLRSLGERFVIGGPFLDQNGVSIGSIVVIESERLDTARAAFNRDPYVTEGLFDSVMIKPFKLNINKTRV